MSSTITQLLEQHKPLQQALDAAAAAASSSCTAACDGRVCDSSALGQASLALGQELVGKLKSFAEQVCAALPLLGCCGNPACLNTEKRSETVLANGKCGKCPRCKACWYCSKECQVAVWLQHKMVCKRLQEAAVSKQ